MSASSLSEDAFENALNDALANYDSDDDDAVNNYDSDDAQEEINAFEIAEAARVAAMSPEERATYEAKKKLEEEQRKIEEELEELAEEYKPILRRSDLASTTNRMRQSFARQAFDEMRKPGDEFGGGKKRTIRKKNRKGTRTTIRKKQRKNRTSTMRKKSRKSRNSRKSNKAR